MKYVTHPTKEISRHRSEIIKCEPKDAQCWSVYSINKEGHEHWIADFATEQLANRYLRLQANGLDKFPNGITSYLETHHEVVSIITSQFEESAVAILRQAEQGRGGIWELAEEITDEFEKMHVKTEWDGDWEETLGSFVDEKLGL